MSLLQLWGCPLYLPRKWNFRFRWSTKAPARRVLLQLSVFPGCHWTSGPSPASHASKVRWHKGAFHTLGNRRLAVYRLFKFFGPRDTKALRASASRLVRCLGVRLCFRFSRTPSILENSHQPKLQVCMVRWDGVCLGLLVLGRWGAGWAMCSSVWFWTRSNHNNSQFRQGKGLQRSEAGLLQPLPFDARGSAGCPHGSSMTKAGSKLGLGPGPGTQGQRARGLALAVAPQVRGG